jgi:SAM-dependent methyltransferase
VLLICSISLRYRKVRDGCASFCFDAGALAALVHSGEQRDGQIMYTEAALYDLIYTQMVDHNAETEKVVELVRRARPNCRTLLDVACGTGEHVRLLGEVYGFEVDGLDLSPEMIARARAKYPRGRFDIADMTDFHLGRCYDGVLCMFGSIGHALTLPGLRKTLACMRDHVAPGGLVVVLPYRTPEAIEVGTDEYTAESGGVRVVRTRRSERDGQRHRVSFHFNVEGPDGTWEADEVHELGLFTVDDMLAAFSDVGLAVTFDPTWDELGNRGVYVATVQI